MQKLAFTLFIVIGSLSAKAQFPYTLTTQTGQTYTPLTSGTSFNNNTIWYGQENYVLTLPFTFKYAGKPSNQFSFLTEQLAVGDTTMVTSGFALSYASLTDRGSASGSQSRSPIRYMVTGTAPNRIFKVEDYNAGFADEYNSYQTLNDSTCIQIWLYETTNVVEIHYGPNSVTHPLDYFTAAGHELIGLFKDLDFASQSLGNFYYLTGSPSSPTIDSTTFATAEPTDGLNGYPANGTVYRFTPIATGIKNIKTSLAGVTVYPTVTANKLTINNSSNQQLQYSILSVAGIIVSENKTLNIGKNSLDVSHEAAGMYIIKVSGNGGEGYYKFVKE